MSEADCVSIVVVLPAAIARDAAKWLERGGDGDCPERRAMVRATDAFHDAVRHQAGVCHPLRAALEAVWSGADYEDTDAVLDQLDDLGYQVVPK